MFTRREFSFSSADGYSTVWGEICLPEGEPKGILMISHGMIDHIGRYEFVKEYFTRHGYAVAGNDHIGHGRSASSPEAFGYLGDRGVDSIVDDLHTANLLVRRELGDLPVILLGHSMGSFMARVYATRYPESIDGIIIHGTGGKNPVLPFGKLLVSLVGLVKGDSHRSELIRSLAFGAYNKRFPNEGADAWLTREGSLVADRATDPYTSFTFTVSGYKALFDALGRANSKSHFSHYPISLPTLIASGEEDPVGDYGKGVRWAYEGYLNEGVKDLTLKLYPGARHELFNESGREEIYADILEFTDRVCDGK